MVLLGSHHNLGGGLLAAARVLGRGPGLAVVHGGLLAASARVPPSLGLVSGHLARGVVGVVLWHGVEVGAVAGVGGLGRGQDDGVGLAVVAVVGLVVDGDLGLVTGIGDLAECR